MLALAVAQLLILLGKIGVFYRASARQTTAAEPSSTLKS
jgi:hypothetical protein